MSSDDPTAAELLTEVNKAILALLQRRVSSYKLHGTEYTYADLDQLRALRTELSRETAGVNRRRVLLGDISRRAT